MNGMNYALIKDGTVVNVIWLSPSNAKDFPAAVPAGNLPVRIGDAWEGGMFYRDGEALLSPLEEANAILDELMGGVMDVQQE